MGRPYLGTERWTLCAGGCCPTWSGAAASSCCWSRGREGSCRSAWAREKRNILLRNRQSTRRILNPLLKLTVDDLYFERLKTDALYWLPRNLEMVQTILSLPANECYIYSSWNGSVHNVLHFDSSSLTILKWEDILLTSFFFCFHRDLDHNELYTEKK